MKLHRFIGKFPLDEKRFWIADEELVHQVRSVLRLKIGDEIILADGKGAEASAKIINFDKKALEVTVLEHFPLHIEHSPHVVLFCSILKRENFELVVQKVTEIGVSEIVPIITERTVKLNLNFERLEKIIKEAAEQSGRTHVPVLHRSVAFGDAVQDAASRNEVNFFCDSSGDELSTLNFKLKNSCGIFVGPEGGWTEMEKIKCKTENGFKTVSLGQFTLRAETAAIVATYEIIQKIIQITK